MTKTKPCQKQKQNRKPQVKTNSSLNVNVKINEVNSLLIRKNFIECILFTNIYGFKII